MLPRWHIILGALLTLGIWIIAPQTPLLYLALLFGASFLIDVDHYMNAVRATQSYSLKRSFEYHKELQKEEDEAKRAKKELPKNRHIFHTIEAHALVGLLSVFWIGFFYIFIGMMFHSLLDILYMVWTDRFERREYFLTIIIRDWWNSRKTD